MEELQQQVVDVAFEPIHKSVHNLLMLLLLKKVDLVCE